MRIEILSGALSKDDEVGVLAQGLLVQSLMAKVSYSCYHIVSLLNVGLIQNSAST